MKISVIIPVLNEADYIANRLAQLRETLAGDVEIIVVDGGSTDASVELAHLFASRVIHSPRGRARQMNAGAAIASGELLLFLHADTVLPARAIELLQRNQNAWGRFDVRFADHGFIFRVIAGMMNLRSRLSSVSTGDQAIFVSRDLFEAVGGFPEIELMEDIAICKLLRRLQPPSCIRERVTTSSRRWRQHGIARTIVLMWWLRLLYVLGVSPARLSRMYR